MGQREILLRTNLGKKAQGVLGAAVAGMEKTGWRCGQKKPEQMAVELEPGGAGAPGLGRGAQAKTLTANWPEEALISDPFLETQ